MSLDTAPPRTLDRSLLAPALGSARSRVGTVARGRAVGVVLAGVLVSRMLVLLAGIAGELILPTHRAIGRSHALGPLLTATVDRFDADYYVGIATTGYGKLSSGRIAFFPLYPELMRVLAVITRSPVLAGTLISLVSFVVALTLLHRLTEAELGRRAADATVLLLCFAPLSFFFSAIYTESLFLALSVGSFSAARGGLWRLACGLAAAAALTRPTGFLLLGPLLVLWRRSGAPRRELWWCALVPAVLLAWLASLALLGYGATGEFHVEHTLWHRMSMFPLEGLAVSLLAMGRGITYLAAGGTFYHPEATGPFPPFAQDVILGGVLIICLIALEACRRLMRPEYAVYAMLVLLLCLASPEQGEPLWCFDRFALTIFPLWMAVGRVLARRRWLLVAVLALGAAALVFYTMQFASWAFIA